jgi:hypothetical protein
MVNLNSLPLDKVWATVKRVLCFFGVFVLIIIGIAVGRFLRTDAPFTGDSSALISVYAGQLSDYQQRLKEAKEGMAWYKKLSEKQVKPVVGTSFVKPDTVWQTSFFPLPGEKVIDSAWVARAFDFEYPFFLKKRHDSLYVSTYNQTRSEFKLYVFGGLGREWDVAARPKELGNAVGLTTSRDWIIFNGFGVGGGMAYDLIKPIPFLNAKTRLTFFKSIELELSTGFPLGARVDTHYWF